MLLKNVSQTDACQPHVSASSRKGCHSPCQWMCEVGSTFGVTDGLAVALVVAGGAVVQGAAPSERGSGSPRQGRGGGCALRDVHPFLRMRLALPTLLEGREDQIR